MAKLVKVDVKIPATVPENSPLEVMYSAPYWAAARAAGGMVEGKAGPIVETGWRSAVSATGGDLLVYGGEVGDPVPPLVGIRVKPRAANVKGVDWEIEGHPRDTGGGAWDGSAIGQDAAPVLATAAQLLSLAELLATGEQQQGQIDAAVQMANTASATANQASADVDAAISNLNSTVDAAAQDAAAGTVARVDAAIADTQQAAATATSAAGLIAWNGGDHTTIPANAGLYRIMTGVETGQVWERLADGNVARREDLEAASAPVVNMIRSNLEATTEQLRAGTFDAGTLSRIYSHLGSLTVVTDTQAPTPDNVSVFQLADGKRAVLDAIPRAGSYFGLRSGQSDSKNTAALADFAEFAQSRTLTNVVDFLYAGAQLLLDPGEYAYGDLPIIRGNVSIASNHPRAALLRYTGTGNSMIFNSDSRGPYYAAPAYTNSVTLRDLSMMSEHGSGLLFGSVIQPNVLISGIEFRKHKSGFVIDMGEAVYFMTVDRCRSTEHHQFLRQSAYCDLLTINGCSLGASDGPHLELNGPTWVVRSSNFESTGGDEAAIKIMMDHTGNGLLVGNRFGSEGNPYRVGEASKVAPYDVIINAPEARVYEGLTVRDNRHFSRAVDELIHEPDGTTRYYSRKKAPILLACGVTGVTISGNEYSYYTDDRYVVGNPSRVIADTPKTEQALIVDRLSDVSEAIRGVATETITTERRRLRVMVEGDWLSPGNRFGAFSSSGNTIPVIGSAIGGVQYPFAFRQLGAYIAEPGAVAGTVAWADVQGSHVRMPLDGAAMPPGTAVYVANDGTPTVAPPPGLTRRVGWTVDRIYPALVRLDFGPLMAPAMPTSGSFVAGDVVDSLNPPLQGNAGSRYVLLGWRRLTTGSGHVLGTDWVERRELTGN